MSLLNAMPIELEYRNNMMTACGSLSLVTLHSMFLLTTKDNAQKLIQLGTKE
jgi:hypothetical protein